MKQVIVIRNDINMSVGKMCAQTAHAACKGYREACRNAYYNDWLANGQPVVVCQIGSKDELEKLIKKAVKLNILCFPVRDAGRTEVDVGTLTCVGFGPDTEERMNKISGSLKLL